MARTRQPKNPAPTSLPGAASSRTDGGPGSKSQPLRVASGQPYGSRKAQEAQQQAAPLPVAPQAGGSTAPGGSAQAPPGPSANPADALFAPTARPNEPVTAGLGPVPARITNPNPDMALQLMYAMFPHPDIARLLGDTS